MKIILFLAIVIASVNAVADGVPNASSLKIPNGMAPTSYGVMMVQPMESPPFSDDTTLTNVIQKQTTAIQDLATRLGLLEERIGKLEQGKH